jgi:cellulose synthase/poly-beta-1,6-N-acetylglucosamine synthase-like glycosyltransferase
LEGIKDALGVAWCTGSGYILRRDALEEIGWFPLGSLAEDVATSTLMLGKGWKTAFIHEPLQFGTVPDSFGSHLKQRTRWVSLKYLDPANISNINRLLEPLILH